MSVQETTYLVLGVKLPFDYFNEEEREALYGGDYCDNVHQKKIGNKDGVTLILDAMNGQYIVAGRVLLKARHHEGEGLEFTSLDITESAREEVARQLAEHFSITVQAVHPMAFTHYS